jgi:hypothetical protein
MPLRRYRFAENRERENLFLFQNKHTTGGVFIVKEPHLWGSETKLDCTRTTMAKKPNAVYVEQRPDGQYALTRPGADRAIAVTPTQAEAIERGQKLPEKPAIHVERVRDTDTGGRDKYRAP